MAQPWTGARRRGIAYGRLSATRKLLRRLPDDLVEPVRKAFREGAAAILADAKAGAPKDTGAGAEALNLQISRDGLSAKVGLVGKRANRRGYHLRFHEYGTKGVADGFGKGIPLPPLPARPFLEPAFDAHSAEIAAKVKAGIARATNRAAGLVESGAGALGIEIAPGDLPEE